MVFSRPANWQVSRSSYNFWKVNSFDVNPIRPLGIVGASVTVKQGYVDYNPRTDNLFPIFAKINKTKGFCGTVLLWVISSFEKKLSEFQGYPFAYFLALYDNESCILNKSNTLHFLNLEAVPGLLAFYRCFRRQKSEEAKGVPFDFF